MTALVFDSRDSWRRAVVEETGLPFSRVRVLRRLGRQSMTVKQVAQAATLDAPAATVAVNDLADRGLVVREVDPANRRCRTVSLTDAGRAVPASVGAIATKVGTSRIASPLAMTLFHTSIAQGNPLQRNHNPGML